MNTERHLLVLNDLSMIGWFCGSEWVWFQVCRQVRFLGKRLLSMSGVSKAIAQSESKETGRCALATAAVGIVGVPFNSC